MSGEKLIGLLTEIRDQQKQQVVNFQRAIDAQTQHAELQRKGRRTFLFLVYAPWAALGILLLRLALPV